MKILKSIALLLAVLAAACTIPHRPIPGGTYHAEGGAERIVVVHSRIFFHVIVDPDHPEFIGGREYPYEVLADGRIHFVVSSNSRFALRLALDYEWYWRDGEIVRIEVETGKATRFVLRD